MSKFGTTLTKTAAIALVFGLVGGVAFQGASAFSSGVFSKAGETQTVAEETSTQTASVDTIQPTNVSAVVTSTNISDMVAETMPSIVAITNLSQEQVRNWYGQVQTYEQESCGSGIIIRQEDNTLYIATNNHVVSGASTLTVQFADDSTASAEIRGTDANDDLAVISVDMSTLTDETKAAIKVATLGDSTALSVGDSAIAIGNALGYGQSVTTGVISALNREVTGTDETTGQQITEYLIQTDAAINPGNSGGALLNVNGEVIGINSSKYSDTSVEGMGFAIPTETAAPILEDLIANGKTTTTGKGYLGIYGTDVSEDVASTYNMPTGVYIAEVIEGSAAEAAGLAKGNIITAVDGEAVASMTELKSAISSHKVGDQITVTIQIADNGTYISKDVAVTLGSESTTTTESSDADGQDTQDGQTSGQEQGAQNGQGSEAEQGTQEDPSGQAEQPQMGQGQMPNQGQMPGQGQTPDQDQQTEQGDGESDDSQGNALDELSPFSRQNN